MSESNERKAGALPDESAGSEETVKETVDASADAAVDGGTSAHEGTGNSAGDSAGDPADDTESVEGLGEDLRVPPGTAGAESVRTMAVLLQAEWDRIYAMSVLSSDAVRVSRPATRFPVDRIPLGRDARVATRLALKRLANRQGIELAERYGRNDRESRAIVQRYRKQGFEDEYDPTGTL